MMTEEEIQSLAARVNKLEGQVAELQRKGKIIDPQCLDEALRELGKKVQGVTPQSTYFNMRFRAFESALMNIKALMGILGENEVKKLSPGVPDQPPAGRLKSKLCTQADIESNWGRYWGQAANAPIRYHRKAWEFYFIAQALWAEEKLIPGAYGLGFGCGNEPLPSLFAKFGAKILGTDLENEDPVAKRWAASNQHAGAVQSLRKKHICPNEDLLNNIQFRSVNMNDIDKDLYNSFDFCWSACALEHLGNIEKGLTFIRRSLDTLKPGGVAVHTTEFTFNDEPSHDNWPTVMYKKQHLIEFSNKLAKEGFQVSEFDFSSGKGQLDRLADLHPKELYSEKMTQSLHLKTVYDGFVCTSVGMIIRKPMA